MTTIENRLTLEMKHRHRHENPDKIHIIIFFADIMRQLANE